MVMTSKIFSIVRRTLFLEAVLRKTFPEFQKAALKIIKPFECALAVFLYVYGFYMTSEVYHGGFMIVLEVYVILCCGFSVILWEML